jgi:outer membrane protein insertion porin family/translocation and assembly module TamA
MRRRRLLRVLFGRGRGRAACLVACSVAGALSAGCNSAALREAQRAACDPHDLSGCVIQDVRIRGNVQVPEEDIEERLATAESAHVFGGALEHVPILALWDRLTAEYERFDRFVLERDLARVERIYRARGFYEAHARAGRVRRLKNGRVRVEIVVDEGVPVRLAKVDLAWKDWRPAEETRDVTRLATEIQGELKLGVPFDEDPYEKTKQKLLRMLTDRGFAYARVEGRVDVDLATHTAKVVYTLTLGPRCDFGDVRIVGLRQIPEKPVRTALGIDKGDPYSTDALDSAEYTLADFGVFASIEVRPELASTPPSGACVVPVTFHVTEGDLKGIRLGLGAELGSRVEAHVLGGWEDRNFFGGLRHFTGEVRPGLVFWPNQLDDLFRAPIEILPELRVSFELRQPNAFEKRTSAVLSGAFYLYCPLINCRPLSFAEQNLTPEAKEKELVAQNLIGYREFAGRVGLERQFANGKFYAGQFMNLRLYDPFSYNQKTLPPGYDTVLVPYLETIATVDLRKGALGKRNTVEPHSGIYFSTDAQLAGGFLGGDADDVRLRPELRAYLPVSKRATLAFRLTTGLLFPRNYGDTLSSGSPPTTPDETASRARDLQILRLRGFYSGGQSSNRGYAYNQIGPNAPADLVYPFTEQQKRARQQALKRGEEPAAIPQVPVGGQTLWESSLELRFPLGAKLGAAMFVDASDVTTGIAELRLTHPHMSTGAGIRYDTPVGPFRLDVGYRIPYLQVIGQSSISGCTTNCPEVVVDETEPSTFFGLPIAVAIAIGEAF